MNRERSYYRKMRAKHIRRKKSLAKHNFDYGYFKYDGMYSKNKIHCSCGMCMAKTRNKGRRHVPGNYAPSINYKHSDAIKVLRMNEAIKEFAS